MKDKSRPTTYWNTRREAHLLLGKMSLCLEFRSFGRLDPKLCLTLETPWTVAHHAPCPWDFPDKNTGVGCHFLLQGIFLTQGSNPGLLHCRWILYWQSHQGSPLNHLITRKSLFHQMQPESPKNWEISKSASQNQCSPPHTQLHKNPFTNALLYLILNTVLRNTLTYFLCPQQITVNNLGNVNRRALFRKQQLIIQPSLQRSRPSNLKISKEFISKQTAWDFPGGSVD